MSKPLRVLIVEDSENDALLLVRELRRGGFEPTFERMDTPETMTAALTGQVWDLVISDYVMPHFSGVAALELLQQSGLDAPFIVVSGSIGEDVAVAAMKAGAHDYLLKDRLSRLAQAVAHALQQKHLRNEKMRAEEALRQRVQEMPSLHEIGQTIINSVDLQTDLDGILEKALTLRAFDIGVIRLLDATGKTLTAASSRGYREPERIRPLNTDPKGPTVGWVQAEVFESRGAYTIESLPSSRGFRAFKAEGVESELAGKSSLLGKTMELHGFLCGE